MSDEAIQLLRELRDEVRGLRRDLAERRSTSVLAREDREKLAALLPAIHSAVGSLTFSVASLLEHATARDAALREALSTCGSSRALGKLLRRAVDQEVGGQRLRLVGSDSAGNLFVVEKGAETLIAHVNRRVVAHR